MNLTPNVKRLIFHKQLMDVIPPGCVDGLGAGVRLLTTPGALQSSLKSAHDWTEAAIQVVRLAAEPNPWKQADDETIATEIMLRVDERMAKNRRT